MGQYGDIVFLVLWRWDRFWYFLVVSLSMYALVT